MPQLSVPDSLGHGLAQVLDWCDDAGGDTSKRELARRALEDRDYAAAFGLASQVIRELRGAGARVPKQIEVVLRLAEGALASEGLQDGMRALSEPSSG